MRCRIRPSVNDGRGVGGRVGLRVGLNVGGGVSSLGISQFADKSSKLPSYLNWQTPSGMKPYSMLNSV